MEGLHLDRGEIEVVGMRGVNIEMFQTVTLLMSGLRSVGWSHISSLCQLTCAGDTSLNLAALFPLGTVVAFEMGPPVEMLRVNVRWR